MPTIEMSSGFSAGLPARIIRLGESGSGMNNSAISGLLSNSGTVSSVSNANGYIFLMSNTVPVSFPTNYSARSADVLVRFAVNSVNTNTGGNFQTSNQTTNPATISTEYVTASGTGVCTWFWWLSVPPASSGINQAPSASIAPFQQIIGTVGILGSGADLEIPTVNITAGEQYRIRNLRLQFPVTWAY